ncbi:3-hydroxyacyl-CoA dehydrogenase NAD-binding domain-containing protein [Acidicapsa ligni]|uniref:3-hydroxyacyl-CoA dehydrogenase NAD-binding domain-containing protein n=1 Tax=Acidicapsa ligni TaxID=542300 RepID=UPI0021DF8FC2|nr:3-hydroxyacyl-CoA dehydrogenase NAD-binding domain-containing protein [Acidicapsa ligni]
MTSNNGFQKVTIIGTGVIGASWAAFFLAQGLDVVATDIAPDADLALRRFVDAAWPALTQLGLAAGATRDRLKFTSDLHVAIKGADLVVENGPERADFKIKLFADLDAHTPVSTILASSSSGIPMTVIQSGCKNPGRCVICHPFNPPHLMPLVEVVGGEKTDEDTVKRAMAFFQSLGKKPIHIRKEMKGFVANRLQAALWREVLFLISEGVADVKAVDDAVSWGPGLRWGVMGPNILGHLGGGQGGIQHFIDHLFQPMTTWWATSDPLLTPELEAQIASGTLELAGNRSIEELERERDNMLLELLATRAKGELAAQAAYESGRKELSANK